MKKYRLGLGLVGGSGINAYEQIGLIKKVGFDEIFFGYHRGENTERRLAAARAHGMPVTSLHAPFIKIDRLWYLTGETEDVIEEQLECIRKCAEYEIPVAVLYVFIGFDRHEPNDAGLANFARLINEAERLGVTIAFENTEGIEYFDSVMEHFKDCDSVKFCLDTGHEICYNPGRELLADYGDRLAYTHINDNLGVCGDAITYLDDLHLLPYDGVLDFEHLGKRLAAANYGGSLTFELSIKSKPGRNENDKYAEMNFEDYLTEAYRRAVRVSEVVKKYRLK